MKQKNDVNIMKSHVSPYLKNWCKIWKICSWAIPWTMWPNRFKIL